MPADLLEAPLDELLAAARERRRGGGLVTYSPKVFIPLTTLCRDVCGYCTFARPPRRGERAFLTEEEVLAIARAGAAAGCTEALFTLGDKPELRYKVARAELAERGCETTLEYLGRAAKLVLEETGLLPHLNPGVMSRDDLVALRPVSASMGIMLETTAERLSARGGPHWASPDKEPSRRLETIDLAGELRIPFTSGILIGIGETRAERIEALQALRALHERHGHLQEVIVQNFRAKPGTRMASHPEPSLEEHLWTIAVARLLLPEDVAVQAPPNLAYDDFPRLLDAGIDDWGGVSPVTIDHVNPEAPWPDRDRLAEATRTRGLELAPRLPVYPQLPLRRLGRSGRPADGVARVRCARARARGRLAPRRARRSPVRRRPGCASGRRRRARRGRARPSLPGSRRRASARVRGGRPAPARGVRRRGQLRRHAEHPVHERLLLPLRLLRLLEGTAGGEPAWRALPRAARRDRPARQEAWDRGATEVCLQGGIHPAFTGDYYASVVEAIRAELPELHIHAFSALEIWQGAATLGLPLEDYLARLRSLGLGSLPGTAAEILDDEVRAVICPDKVTTEQWLAVHAAAHRVGLRSNVTIMFGHVEAPVHWARHLLRAKAQQEQSGGFTEFVPLPFVHMEAPMWLQGRARSGPTFGESLLLHAVARLALHPAITNIQASWVKLGPEGVSAALRAGVNDLGGTLMNESISRSAGSEHGQEMPPESMEALILANGRTPRQRTTLYGDAPAERRAASFSAAPLAEPLNPPVRDAGLKAPPRLVRPGLLARAR